MEFKPVYNIASDNKNISLPPGCEAAIVRRYFGCTCVVIIADKDKKDALKKAFEEVI